MKTTQYYTAHRLGNTENVPVHDILIRRRPLAQLRKYATMSYEEKVKGMNTEVLDTEFLLLFEHGLDQSSALESLESGASYWMESSNDYLWTGFGLTPEAALKALEQADEAFGFSSDS